MTEHKNPGGVYKADCECCGKTDVNCHLRMVENRYLWACVGSCVPAFREEKD